MTAMQGSDPGWMMNFTKEIKDLRKPRTGLDTNKFTISGLIEHNPDCTIFNYLVRKAKLECILNNDVTNLTVFIPSDNAIKQKYPEWYFVNTGYLAAKDIVLSQLLNRKVTLEMMMSSEGLVLPTHHRTGPYKSIYTSYIPQTHRIIVNNMGNILEGNIMVNNGIIHIVDNFLFAPNCSNN